MRAVSALIAFGACVLTAVGGYFGLLALGVVDAALAQGAGLGLGFLIGAVGSLVFWVVFVLLLAAFD